MGTIRGGRRWLWISRPSPGRTTNLVVPVLIAGALLAVCARRYTPVNGLLGARNGALREWGCQALFAGGCLKNSPAHHVKRSCRIASAFPPLCPLQRKPHQKTILVFPASAGGSFRGKTWKSRSFQPCGSCCGSCVWGSAAAGGEAGHCDGCWRTGQLYFCEGLFPPRGFTPGQIHRDPPPSGDISASPLVSAWDHSNMCEGKGG